MENCVSFTHSLTHSLTHSHPDLSITNNLGPITKMAAPYSDQYVHPSVRLSVISSILYYNIKSLKKTLKNLNYHQIEWQWTVIVNILTSKFKFLNKVSILHKHVLSLFVHVCFVDIVNVDLLIANKANIIFRHVIKAKPIP